MSKVQMVVFGKLAIVDEDMVKPMKRKEELVNLAQALKEAIEIKWNGVLDRELEKTMGKIIRLNRTIRSNVQYL